MAVRRGRRYSRDGAGGMLLEVGVEVLRSGRGLPELRMTALFMFYCEPACGVEPLE